MRFLSYIVFALVVATQLPANAFEVVNKQKSYENDRLFNLNIGLGINQFTHTKGVDGANPGLAMQVGLGHRINPWFEAQFVYQLSTMRFNSPDPLTGAGAIQTRAGLNQEYLILKAFYPRVVAQPYISAGFGAYQFFSVNGETGLSFPASYEIPVGAGVQTFIFKNAISLDFDFTYHIMFGQNQDPTTLSFLNVNKISFNMYSLIGGFTFHFL